MLYWDTSALFSFFVSEKKTQPLRELVGMQGSTPTYSSMITPLEFESAIQRRLSDRTLTLREADRARLCGVDFRKRAFLVPFDQNALDTSLHLQKIYGLRPGDALQLASARIGTDHPARVLFLCLDEKLSEAAKREGFRVEAI